MRGRDWRGGRSPFRRECAARPEEWSRRAEPRKAPKKWPPCHFLARVFCENPQTSPRTSDAPSMALLVIQKEKWQGVLLQNVCITKKVPQKKERKLETEGKSFFIIGGVNEFYGDWSRLWSQR